MTEQAYVERDEHRYQDWVRFAQTHGGEYHGPIAMESFKHGWYAGHHDGHAAGAREERERWRQTIQWVKEVLGPLNTGLDAILEVHPASSATPAEARVPAERFTLADFIREELEYRSWSAFTVANRLCVSFAEAERLLAVGNDLSPDDAILLGRLFGASPQLWQKLARRCSGEEGRQTMSDNRRGDNQRGLYPKYVVERTDGRPIEWCFVLELDDPKAGAALMAYADMCESADNLELATELRVRVREYWGGVWDER